VRSYYWERHTSAVHIDLKTLPKDFSVDNRTPFHGQNYTGLPNFRISNGYRGRDNGGYEEEFIVVADDVVSVWRDCDAEIDRRPVYSTFPTFIHKKWNSWRHEKSVTTHPVVIGNSFDKFKEFQNTYRTPILHFHVAGNYLNIIINPNLMDYGVQHKLYPQQTYQEIEMWFANQKYDKEEPIPQTDKQKILTHGLDPKTSFRHPIK
jgi:hypothetical protein